MTEAGQLTSDLIDFPSGIADVRLLNAATAAAALIAKAGEEKFIDGHQKIYNLLHSINKSAGLDKEQIDQSFNLYYELIHMKGETGRLETMRTASHVVGGVRSFKSVIGIALSVARINGEPSPAQQEQIRSIYACIKLYNKLPSPNLGCQIPEIRQRLPKVITVAGAKGGTGKSTTAIHLVIGLLKRGRNVGSIDLDGAQGTLSRFLANRAALMKETGCALEMPRHWRVGHRDLGNFDFKEQGAIASFHTALHELSDCDYLVVDTPAFDCSLARIGCINADILITPLNDSLVDLDTVARIDGCNRVILGPSDYCRFIWEENDRRVALGRCPIDWIVMCNRMGYIRTRNQEEIYRLLRQLSRRIGFRLETGLGERVVYREHFLEGLILLDLLDGPLEGYREQSRLRAEQELNALLQAIGQPAQGQLRKFAGK